MAALIFTDDADFDTKNLRLSVFYRCNLRLRILNLLTVGGGPVPLFLWADAVQR
jgi:hypothetical protein